MFFIHLMLVLILWNICETSVPVITNIRAAINFSSLTYYQFKQTKKQVLLLQETVPLEGVHDYNPVI